MRFFLVLIIGIFIPFNSNAQQMEVASYEKIIDNFAQAAVQNISFQNGINVFITSPKDDNDALKKGFELMHTDHEQDGDWALLFAKDIIVKDYAWLPYRAILYRYQKKNHLVLIQKEKNNKYYFRIFNPVWKNRTPNSKVTQKPANQHETIIDDFAKASVNNLSFQNGLNTFIEAPESDEDALYKGFRVTHTNREYNGGWKILAAKDVIIKDAVWLPYRAILYEFKNKQFIILNQKKDENKYYFRIFNARYGQ